MKLCVSRFFQPSQSLMGNGTVVVSNHRKGVAVHLGIWIDLTHPIDGTYRGNLLPSREMLEVLANAELSAELSAELQTEGRFT